MLAIVDYGVGNLFSLQSSLRYLGYEAVVSGEPDVLARAGHLILPGVGAFGDAAKKLSDTGLDKAVLRHADAGKPLLGICLGMQLLLERSFEYGEHKGLGLIAGDVVSMEPVVPEGYKIPHIGWNILHVPAGKPRSPIFRGFWEGGGHVYFVHSYYADRCPDVIATTEYGAELTAAVGRENVFGCQFHPEKSGPIGLQILKAFCELEGPSC